GERMLSDKPAVDFELTTSVFNGGYLRAIPIARMFSHKIDYMGVWLCRRPVIGQLQSGDQRPVLHLFLRVDVRDVIDDQITCSNCYFVAFVMEPLQVRTMTY